MEEQKQNNEDAPPNESDLDEQIGSLGEDRADDVGFRDRFAEIARDVPGFAGYVIARFREDHCWRMAAGLGYTSLLALVPLSAIAFAMLAAFPVFADIHLEIQDFLFANLLPRSAESIRGFRR